MRKFLLAWVSICLYSIQVIAQEPDNPAKIDANSFSKAVNRHVASVERKVSRQNAKALRKASRQENKILRKIFRRDDSKASELSNRLHDVDARLASVLADPQHYSTPFIPSIDTIRSALSFLGDTPAFLRSQTGNHNLVSSIRKVDALMYRFSDSRAIAQHLEEKKEILRNAMGAVGLRKFLKPLNKTVYYYKAQIEEYTQLVTVKRKLVKRAIAALSQSKTFQDFIMRNSALASMFHLPGGTRPLSNPAGLQTRSQVNSLIQQQIGSAVGSAVAGLSANIAEAHNELKSIKEKILNMGGGSSDIDMPDGFKPNPYKTKNFWNRLELGVNVQSQRARGWLPVRSDIGFSIGYKFNSNFIVGTGGSYRVGWGNNINHIRISHEGISLRSFIDFQIKGNFWLMGGFEQNQVRSPDVDDNFSSKWLWEPSTLIGLCKVVALNGKLAQKVKMHLLLDLWGLDNKTLGQAVKIRIGFFR